MLSLLGHGYFTSRKKGLSGSTMQSLSSIITSLFSICPCQYTQTQQHADTLIRIHPCSIYAHFLDPFLQTEHSLCQTQLECPIYCTPKKVKARYYAIIRQLWVSWKPHDKSCCHKKLGQLEASLNTDHG